MFNSLRYVNFDGCHQRCILFWIKFITYTDSEWVFVSSVFDFVISLHQHANPDQQFHSIFLAMFTSKSKRVDKKFNSNIVEKRSLNVLQCSIFTYSLKICTHEFLQDYNERGGKKWCRIIDENSYLNTVNPYNLKYINSSTRTTQHSGYYRP